MSSETIQNCFQNAFKGQKFEEILDNFPVPPDMSLESFKAQLNPENDMDCHEHYESDEEELESIQEAEENKHVEAVTTSEFLIHLNGVRSYIQSRGASENIYNSIHELEVIGLNDKIESSSKNQPKITGFLLK